MKRLSCAAVLLATFTGTLPVWAGQQGLRPRVTPTVARNSFARNSAMGTANPAVSTAAGPAVSMIQGSAQYADRTPIPYARLRLRNLVTGQIEQTTTADYAGEFSFLISPQPSYVVELVDEAGRVLSTGGVVSAQAGQTAGALVMLPARAMTLAGYFGNTAGAIMSAAASAGITAVTATNPPQTPEK
jgi:hypothetical protein